MSKGAEDLKTSFIKFAASNAALNLIILALIKSGIVKKTLGSQMGRTSSIKMLPFPQTFAVVFWVRKHAMRLTRLIAVNKPFSKAISSRIHS